MYFYVLVAFYLHLSISVNEISCASFTMEWSQSMSGFLNNVGNDLDVTSKPTMEETEEFVPASSSPPTLQKGKNYQETSTTTYYLVLDSTENSETRAQPMSSQSEIDWKLACMCFTIMFSLIMTCKWLTSCLPNICEKIITWKEERRARAQQSASVIRCKTCRELTPHQNRCPNHCNNNHALTTVLDLQSVTGLTPDSSNHFRSLPFPTVNQEISADHVTSLNDSETERARQSQCETPPPPYSPSMSNAGHPKVVIVNSDA